MKKIGFIDYYLDEWHANNYPGFFEEVAGEEMKVCYAYGEIDSPKGGMTNKEWAEKYGVELLSSIEEVIEKSDCIIVLAPDNPETHLRLTELPLKSGKPVYIDKTFATKKAEAEAIFANADAHNTPCYSSSALFFSDELKEVDREGITRIVSAGYGVFEIYFIHQIEQVIALMGYDAKRVMYLGENAHDSLLIEFEGNRYAELCRYDHDPYTMHIGYEDKKGVTIAVKSDFFKNCIRAMADFFNTRKIPVSHEQTLMVVSVIESMKKAKETPFTWVNI